MPRKKIEITAAITRGRGSKSVSSKATAKITRSRKPKETEDFDELTESTVSRTSFASLFANRKRVYLVSGVIVILLLGYIAAKYLVVAWVDKKPLTRFQYYSRLQDKYGKDTREQLISEQLILNEADKRHVSVTSAEIDNQVKTIETQQGGADKLKQALDQQGLTVDELRKQVKFQLLIEKMFGGGINITEQDVDKYMTDNKESLPEIKPEDASGAAKLRQDIQSQLKQQKLSEGFNAWLKEALASNRVNRVAL